MYKKIARMVVLVLMVNSLYAASDNIKKVNRDQNCTEVFIMENGVKRKVLIPNESSKNKLRTSKVNQVSAKDGVLIMFDDASNVNIVEFESRYGLTFVTKMRIGYYVFKNSSKYSDVTIIDQILSNETGVVTIKPNWKMNKSAR